MRITVDLDEELVAQARDLTGITDESALVHAGLQALGGSAPELGAPPRRRSPSGRPQLFELKILDPRLPSWGFPHWGSALAAGLDLHACLEEPLHLAPGAGPVLVSAGFAVKIGEAGWCGLVAPRSGSGHRGLVLGNTVGVVDADYEGPITLSLWNRNAGPDAADIVIAPGERVAQMLFVPVMRPDFALVETFSGASARGGGGFGSTGRGGEGR